MPFAIEQLWRDMIDHENSYAFDGEQVKKSLGGFPKLAVELSPGSSEKVEGCSLIPFYAYGLWPEGGQEWLGVFTTKPDGSLLKKIDGRDPAFFFSTERSEHSVSADSFRKTPIKSFSYSLEWVANLNKSPHESAADEFALELEFVPGVKEK